MTALNIFTIVAHEAMTDNMKTFEIMAMPHVSLEAVEHLARMTIADKGLVFDAIFPVVSLA